MVRNLVNNIIPKTRPIHAPFWHQKALLNHPMTMDRSSLKRDHGFANLFCRARKCHKRPVGGRFYWVVNDDLKARLVLFLQDASTNFCKVN